MERRCDCCACFHETKPAVLDGEGNELQSSEGNCHFHPPKVWAFLVPQRVGGGVMTPHGGGGEQVVAAYPNITVWPVVRGDQFCIEGYRDRVGDPRAQMKPN